MIVRPRVIITAALALVAGCFGGNPDKANILLRKQNQALAATTQSLTLALDSANARIRGLEQQATTIPVLPNDRLQRLYTTQRVELGRLTHAVKLNPASPGDDAIRVYISPLDADGDTLKATGQVTIEIYDLANERAPLISRCDLDAAHFRNQWVGLLTRAFVVDCPLTKPPQHNQLTVRLTFKDELTQRVFEHQRVVTANLPAPATRPSE